MRAAALGRMCCSMNSAIHSAEKDQSKVVSEASELNLFSGDSVLNILRLILDGSELSEVLTLVARLVESLGNGMFCTVWLPDSGGSHLYCAAAPSLPGFPAKAGRMSISSKGGS